MIHLTKSQPAPICLAEEKLKKSGSYRCGDVHTRLQTDFHNKCYICEEKDISSINIEHFIPHKGDIDLMFDWNNLFFACGHCNNIKLANPKYDPILNCLNPNDRILEWIEFEASPFPKSPVKITSLLTSNDAVNNTVDLLDLVYNGHTATKKMESDNIQKKICKELVRFQALLLEYYHETGMSDSEKEDVRNKIRRLLSPKAAFTAFKVWIIKRNTTYMRDFGALL
jgi:hypothetical protein